METIMKQAELDRMGTDDLWSLHVEVSQVLQQRIQQEKTATGRASEAVANPSSVWASAVPAGTPQIP